ncbi:MAG: sigma-54 dependent transcriptional regulator [Candidatus Sumerlaeia bacterium]|nr:sigma-54 dependent transcriptional regulator [Candidatus Sumerlaeia bacterium]
MQPTLLLIDDDPGNLQALELAFARSDYRILTASSASQGVALLDEESPDVVVTDLRMGDAQTAGLDVVRAAVKKQPAPPVIILTAYGTIPSAVEALQLGAFNYLTKPINLAELRVQVARALEKRRLELENESLRAQLDHKFGFEGIVGDSPPMRALFEQMRRVAPTRVTVLILGESGVGKELIARALHQNSPRRNGPFVPVHCAALPETLLESELFGHERGAFTGAVARKPGRFELADGGTLFLDEIGEIPLSMQVALLRVLETREFMRVGGQQSVTVDVRLIAATNRDLERAVAEGRFREDLYYRLNVVTLRVPPLRERASDIPLLVGRFLTDFAREAGRPAPNVTPAALARLMAWPWPGNVRELRNVVENAFLFCKNNEIGVRDLPPAFQESPGRGEWLLPVGPDTRLDDVEKEVLRQTLTLCNGNITQAAKRLGISRRTLQRKIKDLSLPEG